MKKHATEPLSVALVGIGGYAKFYVDALLDKTDPAAYRLVGVIDPYADRSPALARLKAKGAAVCNTLADFYADHPADLVTVTTPIHLHCPQTCEALSHGSHVLCEKPIGPTLQDARRMIQARDRSGRNVAIGYQWSFSKAIQALKADIMSGRLGRPQRLKTLVLWPRTDVYYARNNWAGALADAKGNWILDSPVNNATAHYLHNMFYVLGRQVDRSAVPRKVTAELYRATDITNYDTGAARCVTEDGVELLYYASHAVKDLRGPDFVYEFEKATLAYGGRGGDIVARLADGTEVNYGNPFENPQNKLWDSMAAARGEKRIVCGPEAASSQTLCMNGMQESAKIVDFPRDRIRLLTTEKNEKLTYVDQLGEELGRCFDQNKLPSEMGLGWAVGGREIDLTNYTQFPARR